jgi:hypothetical protein
MEQGAVRGWKLWLAATLATGVCLGLLVGPATGEVLFNGGPGIKAMATGTIVHAHLLRNGSMHLVDGEIAFTGSSFDSGGLRTIYNEVGRRVAGLNATKTASALEVGLGVTPNVNNQLTLAGRAEAASPQAGGPVTKEIGPVDLRPLAWVNLLRGRAMAASSNACTLGSDIGNGVSYVGDAQLLDMGSGASAQSAAPSVIHANTPVAPVNNAVNNAVNTVTQPVNGLLSKVTNQVQEAAPVKLPSVTSPVAQPQGARASSTPRREGMANPVIALDAVGGPRAVSQSMSRTLLVSQRAQDGRLLGNNFGVMSEVRQTIAPVTLFAGTPNEITFEFLGEWVLQAVATGMPGGAYIHYGPGSVSPSTPVIRIIRSGHANTLLKLQDLFGSKGFVLDIPGLAEFAIGEDPRAIGGNASSAPHISPDGNSASAAVDVVRVRALPGATELADLRIGHMETSAQVPSGGVACAIPVAKGSSATSVNVGDTYRQTFTVTNPYDCTLQNVTISDAVSTQQAARFRILSTLRPASVATGGSDLLKALVRWNSVGDIPPHATRTTEATFLAQGGTGVITDRAVANGTLAGCARPGTAVAGVSVATVGTHMLGMSHMVSVRVSGAKVQAAEFNRRGTLPHTGAPILLFVAIAAALLAAGGAGLTLAHQLRRW